MKKLLFHIGFLLVISISTYAQEVSISNINATGKLKVGQVLTSNGATASPTWNSLTSPAVVTGGKFLIIQGTLNNFTIGANAPFTQTDFIDFASQRFNTNGDVTIDLTNNLITINRTGIYHFEGIIKSETSNNQGGNLNPSNVSVGFKINDGISYVLDERIQDSKVIVGQITTFNSTIPFKTDRYLLANQTIKFTVRFQTFGASNLTAIGILGGESFISGHFVSE
jgi:hypothetical protein